MPIKYHTFTNGSFDRTVQIINTNTRICKCGSMILLNKNEMRCSECRVYKCPSAFLALAKNRKSKCSCKYIPIIKYVKSKCPLHLNTYAKTLIQL